MRGLKPVEHLPKRPGGRAVAGLLLAGLTTLGGCGASRAADGSPPAAATDARAAAPAVPAAPAAPPSDTVRIVFTVVPATATAKVLWGKKLLGVIPPRKALVVVRPRDSGPLDIVVRAEGFLPVQTRVYTFADGKLGVKLTPPEEKKTLLGYREPPPPEVVPVPAGAPTSEPGVVPSVAPGAVPGVAPGVTPDAGATP